MQPNAAQSAGAFLHGDRSRRWPERHHVVLYYTTARASATAAVEKDPCRASSGFAAGPGRGGARRGACTGTEGDRSFARRPGRGMARVWRRAGRPLSLPRPVPLGWLYWIAFADPATDRYAARVACVCPCVGLLAAAGWVCALVFGLAELRRPMGRTDALADMCLVCRRGSSIQSRSSGGCDVMLARFLFPSPRRRPSVLARDLSGSNT